MIKIMEWTDKRSLEHTLDILHSGGIIIYPTDTLYGFGCDSKNKDSIQKINHLKNRTGPMSVMASSKKVVQTWLNVKEEEKLDILKVLDGGTTVIVPILKGIVSEDICSSNNNLGIRIPKHLFCKKLSENFPNPIVTTSVNLTNMPAMTDPILIKNQFSGSVDLIIEDGIISGSGSNIQLYENGKWKKIR